MVSPPKNRPTIKRRQIPCQSSPEPGSSDQQKRFYKEPVAKTAKLKIPILKPESPEVRQYKQDFGMQVFSANIPESKNSNDRSLILMISVHDSESKDLHLLTGDVTRRAFREVKPGLTEYLARFQADSYNFHLTAEHHGGHSQGGPVLPDLLKSMHPSSIVFHADPNNRYSHPFTSNMKLAAESGLTAEKIHITGQEGTITFNSGTLRVEKPMSKIALDFENKLLGLLKATPAEILKDQNLKGWWEARKYLAQQLRIAPANVVTLPGSLSYHVSSCPVVQQYVKEGKSAYHTTKRGQAIPFGLTPHDCVLDYLRK
jgi:hypothetical protein